WDFPSFVALEANANQDGVVNEEQFFLGAKRHRGNTDHLPERDATSRAHVEPALPGHWVRPPSKRRRRATEGGSSVSGAGGCLQLQPALDQPAHALQQAQVQ